MDRPEIAVATAGPDRLSILAPVFGRAFVDEPMMRRSMGALGDATFAFTRCFSYFLETALGLGLVLEAGAATGDAVWIPPGQFESKPLGHHCWNTTVGTDAPTAAFVRALVALAPGA
jgi:hypothetical protein